MPENPFWDDGSRRWPGVIVDGPHEGFLLEVYAGQTLALVVTEELRSELHGERVYEATTAVTYEPIMNMGAWSIDDLGRYRYRMAPAASQPV